MFTFLSLENICLYSVLIVVSYNYQSIFSDEIKRKTPYWFFWLFILFFSLYYTPENGDFWGYLNLYENPLINSHFEDFYLWLIKLIPDNYRLWRCVIWGTAGLLAVFTFKRMKIDSGVATIFFLCFALLNTYYYTRNCLGLYLLYFAISLYITDQKNNIIIKLIILTFLISASYFLHRSMPLYIGLAVLAYFLPVKRWILITILITFPLLSQIFHNYYGQILLSDIWMDHYYSEEGFQTAKEIQFSFWGITNMVIKNIPFIYIIYAASGNMKNDMSVTYKLTKTFFVFFCLIYGLSFFFWGIYVHYRFWASSMMPFTLFLASYYSQNRFNPICRRFIWMMIAYYAIAIFQQLGKS